MARHFARHFVQRFLLTLTALRLVLTVVFYNDLRGVLVRPI
jgi:hypothetical protein